MRPTTGLLIAAILALCTSAFAASYSGTLNAPSVAGTSTSQTWTGNVTGVIGDTGGTGLFNPPCDSIICDIYTLTVNVPATFYAANPTYSVHVNVTDVPNAPVTDIDLYVYDASGNLVCDGTSASPTVEDVDCGPLVAGTHPTTTAPTASAPPAPHGPQSPPRSTTTLTSTHPCASPH